MLTHGSLFSGIGGFDLGFQWAGIKTVWQVEINGYCRKVLARHFPEAERFSDIREVGAHNLKGVDIISGGFPCQDISVAGKQAGIDGERSGLWAEFYRIIGELRPRYVVIENVANLVVLGLERVLSDLASIGYDAEWQIISANDVGAPHLRKRIWIVAYPASDRSETGVADQERGDKGEPTEPLNGSEVVADPNQQHGNNRRFRTGKIRQQTPSGLRPSEHWSVEPDVGRVANGIPKRVDRLKGLGNAIIPQIAKIIGWRLVDKGHRIYAGDVVSLGYG